MRTGSSAIQFRGRRGGLRVDSRPKKFRKSRYYQIDLEGLEARTLLATIPAVAPTTVNGSPVGPMNLTSFANATTTSGGNTNSPTIAINPYDSQEVVAVWGEDISNLSPTPQTTARIEMSFSVNGGTSWSATSDLGVLPDPLFIPPRHRPLPTLR
jgi:hypothetical protein